MREIINRVEWIATKVQWLVVLACLLAMIYGSYTLSHYVEGTQVEKQEAEVILDAGHGGDDPGKVGINNALEKDINLQIAKKVEKLLQQEGISVLMTREDDAGLEEEGSTNKKVDDMKARVQLINDTKPVLAVSIHQNSYPDEAVSGAQVFYFTQSEQGKEIAEILQEELRTVDTENNRQAKANDTYYLLKRTEVPTVIVECGFLSNWEEAEKLAGEDYQNEMAKAICAGIRSCLEKLGEKE